MKHYILLNHDAGPSAGWDVFFEMLLKGNHLIGGSSLECGLSVRGEIWGAVITPTLGGYIVIQASDLEAAKQIAKMCPIHLSGGTVEIFTCVADEVDEKEEETESSQEARNPEFIFFNHGVGRPCDWDKFFDSMIPSGHLLAGSSLAEGLAVRKETCIPPISPTTTGYMLLQACDFEEAKQFALRCPVHKAGGTVEIFKLIQEEG